MKLRLLNITLLLAIIGQGALAQTDKTGYTIHVKVILYDSLAFLREKCDEATIKLDCKKQDTHYNASTDTSGMATLSGLPAGHYVFTCLKENVDTFTTTLNIRHVSVKRFIFRKRRLHLSIRYNWRLERMYTYKKKVEESELEVELYIGKKHGVRLVPYVEAESDR